MPQLESDSQEAGRPGGRQPPNACCFRRAGCDDGALDAGAAEPNPTDPEEQPKHTAATWRSAQMRFTALERCCASSSAILWEKGRTVATTARVRGEPFEEPPAPQRHGGNPAAQRAAHGGACGRHRYAQLPECGALATKSVCGTSHLLGCDAAGDGFNQAAGWDELLRVPGRGERKRPSVTATPFLETICG
jgi:hypothetical protein